MSVKEIKEAIENKKILFGIKQAIKHKKTIDTVFIAKDTRDDTVAKIENADMEFVVLGTKAELTKNLNLDFTSEVFAIQK
ncbi:MAG: ribosomal protein L7Ae-like RNA K-turn-binding protein [Patescibacteria group bacterium]|jgi:ribosomal protein L7Ae-like RNA K-turn-binding protein